MTTFQALGSLSNQGQLHGLHSPSKVRADKDLLALLLPLLVGLVGSLPGSDGQGPLDGLEGDLWNIGEGRPQQALAAQALLGLVAPLLLLVLLLFLRLVGCRSHVLDV